MLWKLTEEMHLSAQDEKTLSDIYKQSLEKKAKNQAALQKLVQDHSKFKAPAEKSKFLNDYKKLLSEYNQINLEELNRLEKAFGSEKASQYVIVKSELASKIKSLIVSEKGEKSEKLDKEEKAPSRVNLPDPKIIEE
ncbi:MAG: hypothetical protein BroJett040_20420 [Oligoflexia bacterium]|nr:MAG: hypothetical protein BroJett040_20420 [Oligoflexia bacterium]